MAQKYVDQANTNNDGVSRLGPQTPRMTVLSDGSPVWLEADGASHVYLCFSPDHVTVIQLFTWTYGITLYNDPAVAMAVTVDASDNIYVVYMTTGSSAICKAFAKGSGHTWTPETATAAISVGSSLVLTAAPCDAVWCNTGGGTSGAGHLLIVTIGPGPGDNDTYAVIDAGIALTGAGTNPGTSIEVNAIAGSNAFGNVNTPTDISLAADGFGATNGLGAEVAAGAFVGAGSWSVDSSGNLTTVDIDQDFISDATSTVLSCRALRLSANLFAVICETSNGYYVARYSQTAKLTAAALGTPTNLPRHSPVSHLRVWDAFLDPAVANKLWVLAPAPPSGGVQQVWRASAACGAGVAWAGAATADDVLTNTAGDATASGMFAVRCVGDARGSSAVDWQVGVESAATPAWALDGDVSFGVLGGLCMII